MSKRQTEGKRDRKREEHPLVNDENHAHCKEPKPSGRVENQ